MHSERAYRGVTYLHLCLCGDFAKRRVQSRPQLPNALSAFPVLAGRVRLLSDRRSSKCRLRIAMSGFRRPAHSGAKPTALSRIKDDYIYIEMVRINYDCGRHERVEGAALQTGLLLTVST